MNIGFIPPRFGLQCTEFSCLDLNIIVLLAVTYSLLRDFVIYNIITINISYADKAENIL